MTIRNMSLCCGSSAKLEGKAQEQTLTQSSLCCGSIEYFKKKRLDGKDLLWIKLRILCDSDGYSLWKDSFVDVNDVRSCLQSNEIDVYNVYEKTPGLYIARAKAASINELNEWKVDGPNEGLCVRTFYTIQDLSANDMFSSDSCWLSTMIDDRSIYSLFESIKEISTH
jgi:hypothetical protein